MGWKPRRKPTLANRPPAWTWPRARCWPGCRSRPRLYDPLLYPEAAKTRQAVVLDLMVKHGDITPEAARLAKAETIQYAATAFPIEAPHFVFYVWNLLEQKYGPDVLNSGLTVQTTLDLDLTRAAQAIAQRRLAEIADRKGAPANATDAALVALDPHTGQILAMLGSPDYFDATQLWRGQPGAGAAPARQRHQAHHLCRRLLARILRCHQTPPAAPPPSRALRRPAPGRRPP